MAWKKMYEGAEPLRINKWLAEEGVCSRREADALILKGLVKVDGQDAIAGQKIEAIQTLTLEQKATRQLDTSSRSSTTNPSESYQVHQKRAKSRQCA